MCAYVYVVIFATKVRVCYDFCNKSACFVIFATKMRLFCDFHYNNCVFGISASNFSFYHEIGVTQGYTRKIPDQDLHYPIIPD